MIETGALIPPNVVMISRIIWAAMVMGQVIFAGVIAFLISNDSIKPQHVPVKLLTLIDAMLLIFGAAAGWLIGRLFVKTISDGSVAVRRYQTANIIGMALLEGPSFFGLVIILMSARWWPVGIVPAVSLCLQILRFPRGYRR